MVTEKETEKAMTTVRFSWGWPQRLTHGISSLLRNVRPKRISPHRSRRNDDDDSENCFITHSSPAVSVPHPKSSSARTSTHDTREKGKRRAVRHALRNDSTPNVVHRCERSIEEKKKGLAPLKIKPAASSSEPTSSRLITRRGSEPFDSVGSTRPSSSRGKEEKNGRSPMRTPSDERTRHRFSLSSMKYWRSQTTHHTRSQTPSQASSPLDSSSLGSSQDKASQPLAPADIAVRRSDEVLRHHGREYAQSSRIHDADTCGGLTAARRASSWGEPMNYAEEVTSLTSGEHDGLDDDALFLGAGGVCNDPSTLTTNLPIGLGHVQPHPRIADEPLRHPQPERLYIGPGMYHLFYENSPCDAAGAPGPSSSSVHSSCASGCSGRCGGRSVQLRSPMTSPSPLQQVVYESDLNQTSEDEFDDDLDSDSSFFRDTHRQRQRQEAVLRAQVDRLYLDDEEEEEEDAPIEVKRRRPSLSVTAASPPPLSNFTHEFPMMMRNPSRSPARENLGYYEQSMLRS